MKQETSMIILVIFSALLFVIHQYMQWIVQMNIDFIDDYLDPAVLMPLVLYAVLWERRIVLNNKKMNLPYLVIFGYFVTMAVLGELLFPLLSDRFTADYWDILAYAFGTIVYVTVREVSLPKNATHSRSFF